jgi:hypothetical protein
VIIEPGLCQDQRRQINDLLPGEVLARDTRDIPLAPIPRQVLRDLDLQGGGNHALRPDPGQLIEGHSDQPHHSFVHLRSDKLQHWWRTFLPGWHRGLRGRFSTSPEGYVASLAHPQLSTIARRLAAGRGSG